MTSELLSEHEFRRRVAFWLLDNDRGACLPSVSYPHLTLPTSDLV